MIHGLLPKTSGEDPMLSCSPSIETISPIMKMSETELGKFCDLLKDFLSELKSSKLILSRHAAGTSREVSSVREERGGPDGGIWEWIGLTFAGTEETLLVRKA